MRLKSFEHAENARVRPRSDLLLESSELSVCKGGFLPGANYAEISDVHTERRGEKLAQPSTRVRGGLRAQFEAREPLEKMVHQHNQKLLLRMEELIEASRSSSRPSCDRFDGSGFVPLLAKK